MGAEEAPEEAGAGVDRDHDHATEQRIFLTVHLVDDNDPAECDAVDECAGDHERDDDSPAGDDRGRADDNRGRADDNRGRADDDARDHNDDLAVHAGVQ
jgi:hypothetical protein